MRSLTLHPDLDNIDTLTQYDVEPSQHAQWAVDCSAKFRFLRALFDGIRDQTLHVAVVTPPGRIVQLVSTFLTGINVRHRRMGHVAESSINSDHEGLMVTLASDEEEVAGSELSPADLIIALSPSVGEECAPIQAFSRDAGRASPLITLVIPGSIEHIDQSVSATLAPQARLRALISGVWHYRKDAGKLIDEYIAPDAVGSTIAEYIAAQNDRGVWPVGDLEPLVGVESQTESDLEHTSEHDTAGAKRSFAAEGSMDDSSEPVKKARFEHPEAPELPMTINPQDIEIAHVSDSVNRPTQLPGSSDAALLTDTERCLHRLLKEAQSKLEEQTEALADLQYRHEDQHARLHEASSERDSAILTAQKAVSRMNDLNSTVSMLKQERTALQTQLEEANARLLAHPMPERAELEAMRLAAEQARAETEQLEKRLQSAKDEAEYSRSNYQTASQSAQGLSSQNTELENQLATLQNKATGEQVKLREMGYDEQTKNLRNENKRLKAMLKGRDQGLKARDEEITRLKEVTRGRMTTRGSSVPRTPRLGSPMKMDGIRGRGSRQTSPAANELKGKAPHLHPLRNG